MIVFFFFNFYYCFFSSVFVSRLFLSPLWLCVNLITSFIFARRIVQNDACFFLVRFSYFHRYSCGPRKRLQKTCWNKKLYHCLSRILLCYTFENCVQYDYLYFILFIPRCTLIYHDFRLLYANMKMHPINFYVCFNRIRFSENV